MKPEAQIAAIAEACGWILEPAGKDSFGVFYSSFWRHPNQQGVHKLPNYLNDLNAMRLVQASLNKEQHGVFGGNLWLMFGEKENRDFNPMLMSSQGMMWLGANTTAAQCAEAFLRTIGKWIPEDETAPVCSPKG